MRNWSIAMLAALAALAACAPRIVPPAPPPPSPEPQARPPAPLPPPPPVQWEDSPLSPGDWSYRGEGASSAEALAAAQLAHAQDAATGSPAPPAPFVTFGAPW